MRLLAEIKAEEEIWNPHVARFPFFLSLFAFVCFFLFLRLLLFLSFLFAVCFFLLCFLFLYLLVSFFPFVCLLVSLIDCPSQGKLSSTKSAVFFHCSNGL